MNEGQVRRVSSVEEAASVLDYYNGFHDGFMKRIAIESMDEIHADLSQSCTGVFTVEIDFAHYNYQRGSERLGPHHRTVHAEFTNVQDILWDFREGFLGNTIISLSVVSVSRRKGGEAAVEQCLALRLGRHFYLEEYRRHEFRESQLFTFKNAKFID